MFIDTAKVKFRAGKGGDGRVSFRRERYIDKGGPDGGDGGRGGDVILIASRNHNSLSDFRYKKERIAPDGNPGGNSKRRGKSAKALEVMLPVGTAVMLESGELLRDMVNDGETFVIVRGGSGGFGNAHFTSSTRQAPKCSRV